MPTLHRLATLRDDVIFFIYLYQSYHYRVDHKRINEFGQGGDDDEPEQEEDKKDEGEDVKAVTEGGEATGVEKAGGEGLRKRGD